MNWYLYVDERILLFHGLFINNTFNFRNTILYADKLNLLSYKLWYKKKKCWLFNSFFWNKNLLKRLLNKIWDKFISVTKLENLNRKHFYFVMVLTINEYSKQVNFIHLVWYNVPRVSNRRFILLFYWSQNIYFISIA